MLPGNLKRKATYTMAHSVYLCHNFDGIYYIAQFNYTKNRALASASAVASALFFRLFCYSPLSFLGFA